VPDYDNLMREVDCSTIAQPRKLEPIQVRAGEVLQSERILKPTIDDKPGGRDTVFITAHPNHARRRGVAPLPRSDSQSPAPKARRDLASQHTRRPEQSRTVSVRSAREPQRRAGGDSGTSALFVLDLPSIQHCPVKRIEKWNSIPF